MSGPFPWFAEERLRHGCADLDTGGDGWFYAICDCGLDLGEFPDVVTAADALIDHVIERSLRP